MVIVELTMVVVAKELLPLNELLPVNVAKVEVSAKLLKEMPIILAPEKFTVPFCTERLVVVALTATRLVSDTFVKKPLVDVIEVANKIVDVMAVPLALVKNNGPVSVPPIRGR